MQTYYTKPGANKKAVRYVVLAAALLGMVGFSAYVLLFDQGGAVPSLATNASPPAGNLVEVSLAENSQVVPAAVKEEGSLEASGAASAGLPGQYLNFPAGNIQARTEFLAQLDAVKLKVSIAEELAKLAKLNAPAQPVIPAPAATDGVSSGLNLPAPKVLAVVGIDGHLVAKVATSSGVRTMKPGDSFGLGRVERITFEGVHVRDGDRRQFLAVEE